MLRFETTLAVRHLRSGGSQTLLTVSAVAVGVIVVVFIASLVFGLRDRITSLITDLLPAVTVTVEEPEPTPLSEIEGPPGGPVISSRVERQSAQRKEIENWPRAVEVIRDIPHVRAVAPAVVGQGFIARGGQRLGVQVFGATPEQLDEITSITKYVYAGHYLGLGPEEIVLSNQMAQDLGVELGDRVRLTSTESLSDTFRVAGLYDTGQGEGMGTRAYVALRSAQSLYATGTAVGTILVGLDDIFRADQVADRIMALLPYEAESWSRQNPDAVASLGAQSAVAYLVSAFSLIASGFAIASVLIVSVVQKGKQIGILKSMGAKSRQILTVFTLEGLGIALIGSTLGAVLGSLVVWGLGLIKQPVTRIGAEPESLFPAALSWGIVVAAMVAATVSTVIAAFLPARRAAQLDPVEVMR